MSQTSTVFQHLDNVVQSFVECLSPYREVDEGHRFPWLNRVWTSDIFRRAHLDVVDVRDTKKLYMVHLCVFPHTSDPSPIFGFDLIAGPNKVTGAFHDFSPTSGISILDRYFAQMSESFSPSKARELPEWAREIFSGNMIAAGNVSDPEELDAILNMAKGNLTQYLRAVGVTRLGDWAEKQNKYCANQKKNPHTPRVMESLGFDKETVNDFINTCLFPELPARRD